MNLNGNHFKDISGTHGISGILYPPFKRDYGFYKYEGKGSKQPSSYTKQLNESKVGINLHLTSPGVAPQRRNGYSDSQPPIGEGILIGGVDFNYTLAGGYEAEVDGHRIYLSPDIGGWTYQLVCCGGSKESKVKPFDQCLKDALWILTGKYLPYGRG